VSEIRRYERIEKELPVRLHIPGGPEGLKFEAFCSSSNLALGGVFVTSNFLLRPGLELYCELGLPDGPLSIRSQVSHVVEIDHPEFTTGMGIEFLDVDAHGRETLLRYFTPLRYSRFFEAFVGEFPHLERDLPLRDVSLVLNLWEEWKIKNEGGPSATASGAPEAPSRTGRAAPQARAARGRR
jgi:PilZ domain